MDTSSPPARRWAPQAWRCAALLLCACQTTTTPPAPTRSASAPADLVLVVLEDAPLLRPTDLPASTMLSGALSVHPAPSTAWAALLSGQWPGTVSASPPNTIHGVLRLYGYAPRVHPSPSLAAAAERSPWLMEGLDPLPGPCPADSLRTALAMPPPSPDGAALSIIAVPADDPACPGARAAVLRELATSTSAEAHPRHVALVGLNAPGAALRDGDLRAQMAFQGPGWTTTRVAGPATVVDVLPTLLGLGGAVVPSDAAGVNLTLSATLGTAALPPVVVLQDAERNALLRTARHRLWLPAEHRAALGGTEPLPATIQDALVVETLEGTPETGASAEAVIQLARTWERSLAGRTAADRAGADTLRQLLAEQGYWD